MIVEKLVEILEAEVYTGREQLNLDVQAACGADLMSDVMAFVKDRVVLLTGLMNPQALRTADLLDIKVIVFVRGKKPPSEIVELGKRMGMITMTTKFSMFLACGKLYEAGLRSGGVREIE